MTSDLFPRQDNRISGSVSLIRPAYEGVLDRMARLASFGTSKPIASNIEIGQRQEAQAVDDLLLFAIYARRLLKCTNTFTLAKNVSIGLWKFTGSEAEIRCCLTSETISLWKLLGVTVHHELIEIVRYHLQAKILFGCGLSSLVEDLLVGETAYHFNPKVIVKSDKSDAMMFDILQIVDQFQNKLLYPVVSACEDEAVYLEKDNVI